MLYDLERERGASALKTFRMAALQNVFESLLKHIMAIITMMQLNSLTLEIVFLRVLVLVASLKSHQSWNETSVRRKCA